MNDGKFDSFKRIDSFEQIHKSDSVILLRHDVITSSRGLNIFIPWTTLQTKYIYISWVKKHFACFNKMQHAVYYFGWTAIKIYFASVKSSIPSKFFWIVSKSRWFSCGWFTEKTRLTIMIRFVSNMIIFFLRVTKTVSMLHAWNFTFYYTSLLLDKLQIQNWHD